MALINPSDLTYSLIPETIPGTTPTASATRYEFPASSDQAPPTFSAAEIASATKRPNRESNGVQQGLTSGEVTLETRLQYGPVFDTLFASALSGTWATKTLKGGVADSFVSLITCLKTDTAVNPAPGNGEYYSDAGMIVNSVSLTARAKEGVTVSFGLIGLNRTRSVTDNALTVTKLPGAAFEFSYKDVKNVKIGSTSYSFSELTFETSQEREILGVLGQQQGTGVGTSGVRTTKMTLKLFRDSVANALPTITGAAQKVSFEVGTTGNGYRFTLPAAFGKLPTDEVNGSIVFVNLDFNAAYDDTTGCGVMIEQL